jgi:hypothetical protein
MHVNTPKLRVLELDSGPTAWYDTASRIDLSKSRQQMDQRRGEDDSGRD